MASALVALDLLLLRHFGESALGRRARKWILEKYVNISVERKSFQGRMWRTLLWAWEINHPSRKCFQPQLLEGIYCSSLTDPMDRTVYARSTVTIWVFILVAWFVGTVLFALGTFMTRPQNPIVPIGSQQSSED